MFTFPKNGHSSANLGIENIFLVNQFFSSIFLYRIYILYLPSYVKDEMFGLIEISETDGKNNNTRERKKMIYTWSEPGTGSFYADFQSTQWMSKFMIKVGGVRPPQISQYFVWTSPIFYWHSYKSK